jgi:ectoine hydroxylase-related dioxygenase (phytanoyl-CoA dioxygenase family)
LNLPALSTRYRVGSAARREFQRDGHTVLRGLATRAEIEAHRPAILEAGRAMRTDHRPLEERDTYGKAFVQLMNLWRLDPRVQAFVWARRFAQAAADLMGVPAVRLYHDQALHKEPGGGPTPWHRDQFYWPLDTEHTITMWMPLVDATAEMGLVRFALGSHRLGALGDLPIGDESQRVLQALIEREGLTCTDHQHFAPGDASFHSGWTLHSAGPNRSERMREVMTVIYFADGTRVGALDHPARRNDCDAWLGGIAPGELAAGPLNPLL